jgi:hypothetical protein
MKFMNLLQLYNVNSDTFDCPNLMLVIMLIMHRFLVGLLKHWYSYIYICDTFNCPSLMLVIMLIMHRFLVGLLRHWYSYIYICDCIGHWFKLICFGTCLGKKRGIISELESMKWISSMSFNLNGTSSAYANEVEDEVIGLRPIGCLRYQ